MINEHAHTQTRRMDSLSRVRSSSCWVSRFKAAPYKISKIGHDTYLARVSSSFFPTSLCGVLVFGCALTPASSRPARRLPTQLNSHTTYSHTTYSRTTYSHTSCPHTTCPHTTYSHTQLTHTQLAHTQLTHTQLVLTQLVLTHTCLTHNLSSHNLSTHNLLTHTTYSHTTYPHTTCPHTTCPHTTYSHTHTTCHTHNLSTHNLLTHNLLTHTHNLLTHNILAHTHNLLTHNLLTHTHNLLTHKLATWTFNCAWQAWHLWPLSHTAVCVTHVATYGTGLALVTHNLVPQWTHTLSHATVCVAGVALTALGWHWWRAWFPRVHNCSHIDFTLHTTGRRGTWRHRPSLCVAAVALGDIDLQFAWQAWHLATSTVHFAWQAVVPSGDTYGIWLALRGALGSQWTPLSLVCVAAVAHGDTAFTLRGRRGTATSTCTSAWHGMALTVHGLALDGALGIQTVDSHGRRGCLRGSHGSLATWTSTLRGRRGAWRHRPSLCVAGAALGDIDLHFAWHAWHLAISTVTLCGRRGTWQHGPRI